MSYLIATPVTKLLTTYLRKSDVASALRNGSDYNDEIIQNETRNLTFCASAGIASTDEFNILKG